MAKDELWIQEAIGKPGTLRSYVAKKYGKRGFTKSRKTGHPIIKETVITKLAKKKGKIGKKARLAKTLRRLGGRKKRRRKTKRKRKSAKKKQRSRKRSR